MPPEGTGYRWLYVDAKATRKSPQPNRLTKQAERRHGPRPWNGVSLRKRATLGYMISVLASGWLGSIRSWGMPRVPSILTEISGAVVAFPVSGEVFECLSVCEGGICTYLQEIPFLAQASPCLAQPGHHGS